MTDTTRNIDDLRRRLFDAMDGLKDGSLGVDRARAISDMAQVIVNTAKVEVEFLRVTESDDKPKFLALEGADAASPNGIQRIVRHRLKG
jgi:hypothetical protein